MAPSCDSFRHDREIQPDYTIAICIALRVPVHLRFPEEAMKLKRPYLLRALYEWILDNRCTPHLLVDADYPGTLVPRQFVKEGKIVLNISPTAVRDLLMDDAAVSFNARFSGVPMKVRLPILSVLGIYARENGEGMLFPVEQDSPDPEPQKKKTPSGQKQADLSKKSRPALKVIK